MSERIKRIEFVFADWCNLYHRYNTSYRDGTPITKYLNY